MSGITTRRAAVCGGALVVAIGAGAVAVPAAGASPLDGTAPAVPTIVSTTVPTIVSTTVPTVVSTTVPTVVSSTAPTVVSTTVPTVVSSTAPTVVSTTVPTVVSTTAPTVVSTTVPAVTGTDGTGLVGVSAGGSGSNGGVAVTVGSDGSGGSVASVELGGSGSGPLVSVGATGSSGVAGTSGVSGLDGAAGSGAAGTTGSGAPAVDGGLLGLGLRRSIPVVFPAKDGYRDSVSFTLDGLTSSGAPEAVEGVAVLRRGSTVVKRWKIVRSDQVLTWNGTSGSKIVPGTYRLTAGARDAAHHAFAAASAVRVSAKRLIATTSRVSALDVSGTHAMAPAPRSGLDKGRVTVRVTTVASKVRGTHRLIFERNGQRIVLPVKKGTHTSRPITVPASFTRFTIRHTWKKGQVALKAIRYVYSYQTLR